MTQPMIIFDVNETLLDLETMTPIFERIFGDELAMRVWFANLILYSQALTLARAYAPFADIGAAVLQMPANIRRVRARRALPRRAQPPR
jgi:2-haloacid dehalogenase